MYNTDVLKNTKCIMKLKFLFSIILVAFVLVSKANANYDPEIVKNNWLSWTNEERLKVWVSSLVLNENLNKTALDWSTYSKNRWYIDHKRVWQKSYYDFKKIWSWFNSEWVSFKKVNRTTFSESIGWNTYTCNTSDCTTQVSNAINKTFVMYMREKGKKNWTHYQSMINKYFRQIWIWLVLDETKHRYYITIHYWTEVVLK